MAWQPLRQEGLSGPWEPGILLLATSCITFSTACVSQPLRISRVSAWLEAYHWCNSLPSPWPQLGGVSWAGGRAESVVATKGMLASSSSDCYHLSVLVWAKSKRTCIPGAWVVFLKIYLCVCFFSPCIFSSHQAGSFRLYCHREGMWEGKRQSLLFLVYQAVRKM